MTQSNALEGANVLITGVCGTIGHGLLKRLDDFNVAKVVGIDINEAEIFDLMRHNRDRPNRKFFLCDIRNRDELSTRMHGVDVVFHAAAYKHVLLCEDAPSDAISTNVLGTQNLIHVARANEVKRVLFTSSDKAVNPTNVMGASKLLGERIMTAAASQQTTNAGTIFASTRFGNVLGSRGSVAPVFADQIKHGSPLTITDYRMNRFIMSTEEAVDLLISSMDCAVGGEIFVTKMHAVDISVLAEVMRESLAPRFDRKPEDINIVEIGAQPGEKFYEELTNSEEVRRTMESENLFTVLPAFGDQADQHFGTQDVGIDMPYTSESQEKLSHSDLTAYLESTGLFSELCEGK